MEGVGGTAPAGEAGADGVQGSAEETPLSGEPDPAERAAAAERLAEEYLAQLQRLKADFDNYRRRMMHEQGRWQDQAVGRFVGELLPVLDNLERGLQSAETAGDVAALRQGLALILRQFQEVLERSGVRPVEALGCPFDPTCHEAMVRVEEEGYEQDTVVEVFQKGYVYKGTVLRPALVKVAVGRRGEMAEPGVSGDGPAGDRG